MPYQIFDQTRSTTLLIQLEIPFFNVQNQQTTNQNFSLCNPPDIIDFRIQITQKIVMKNHNNFWFNFGGYTKYKLLN